MQKVNAERLRKVNTKLHNLTQSYRYLGLMLLLLDAIYLTLLLIHAQVHQRLVDLLTLGRQEDIEQIVDDACLSLQ